MALKLKQLASRTVSTIAQADELLREYLDALRDIQRVLRDHEQRIKDLE